MRRTSQQGTDAPQSPGLFRDDAHKADLESRNALLQFDEVLRLASAHGQNLRISPQIIVDLQRLAISGIYVCAGQYRRWGIGITNTPHEPPPWQQVEGLVAEMCEYANSHVSNPIHVSAYLMWRINWIHPFGGGNGRTSRAASYLMLSAGIGVVLPGSPTIPDQIVQDRTPYYAALGAADTAFASGITDVSAMEQLIANHLQRQLQSVNPIKTT